jgi:pimeloyl-ACP methyl ester carboxylesterase
LSSNDEFARKLGSFAASQGLDDYTIIAHSQGGMAALHLYNYYWTGLDNNSGLKRIQSVGTPYQGSSLSSWSKVYPNGCKYVKDLTHAGAASWLTGISTQSRWAVHYYYTAGTKSCSFFTNLLLKSPNDGVTEAIYAKLPGGKFFKQLHT